eukprot:TRINITY_DN4879_c0_g1_i1.p5 TRINITY_DN4879_c0_g1~~TRINITY_DN4879_c0_g1_i1.p5  ORF type:complete len:111 (-),score=8.86 TRINITY_DN4879_c0_g1_i1:92-424(-)
MGRTHASRTNLSNAQAQIEMIEEVLKWAGVESVRNALDVGCGIGGSSRHISGKYSCNVHGITLSPKQAQRGNELNQLRGLKDRVNFQIDDVVVRYVGKKKEETKKQGSRN